MTWVEVFAVLIVSHAIGDFVLQTDWQATHKFGGLGRDGVSRRALFSHVTTYGIACAPALAWVAVENGAIAIAVAGVVVGTHLIQDDGRLLTGYIRHVKHSDSGPGDSLFMLVDQSFHLTALLGAALLAAA
jgi:hypothetical protein